MRLREPELIDRLAGEYVLGTLRGAARSRFERLRAENPEIERHVMRWEDRLAPLALSLAPVAPARASWAAIARRAGIDRERATPSPWLRALAAGVVAIALGVGAWLALREPATRPLATFAAAEGAEIWRMSIDREGESLAIETVGDASLPPDRSYELWALPDDGSAAVSLGVMPREGRLTRDLSASQRAALRGSSKVAVSLEPLGGSPTGVATGPVVYVAPTLSRS